MATNHHRRNSPRTPNVTPRSYVPVRRFRHTAAFSQRTRGRHKDVLRGFSPPEDWHEPQEEVEGYRFVVQDAGPGYRHVLTPAEITERLNQLPPAMLAPLQVVQLSRMTRKKERFPCYGMQWGATLYLYPIESSLVEFYGRPPTPRERTEARMYGGRWIEYAPESWKLVWTEAAIKDFYLNNILIHELGHLLDDRNSSHIDRERFAEWFAIEHGYRATQGGESRPRAQSNRRRRHHAD